MINTLRTLIAHSICSILFITFSLGEEMNKMWGETTVKLRAENAKRGQLFDEGNYALFIHWGLYSQIANKVDDKTYYGIGEWIMNPRMANIPPEEYKLEAAKFNPESFNAKEIVQLAKDAGMKYIVITAKHHDGFAMYHSKVDTFNIVDATPWKKDPMKELAAICKEEGLGFGFYYSHNQDWTFPGGNGGPEQDADGNPATFEDYFKKKCLPQVTELVKDYGQIEVIWFDTPGEMPKSYVQELVDVVRKHQPNALISGRAGHNLGDYQTLGDMEVPHQNVEGLWESVDTTNDSWAYAWYDQNWKTPKKILHRLMSCIGRGGTYMLNVGPDGKGAVPQRAKDALNEAGAWIKRYPQVVYNVEPSPWKHELPWGDVTKKENTLFLNIFTWPSSGKLYLPGLKTTPSAITLYNQGKQVDLTSKREDNWLILDLPFFAPEKLASVIRLDFDSEPQVDPTFAVDPNIGTEIYAQFSKAQDAKIIKDRWMEKFGEWICVYPVSNWKENGTASWEVDILQPGPHQVSLNYAGEGRLVWSIEIKDGEKIQNEQNSSHNYQQFPFGWLNFPKKGKYTVQVHCIEGKTESAKLKSIYIKPIKK